MRLIETSHLKMWAASKQSETRFPYIVKSLICAAIQPEDLRMPSGDAVWVPGYDGEIVNREENRFVPMGLSVWELGTDTDFKGKATRDYRKRTEDKPDDGKKRKVASQIDRSQVTFVFVTPHIWSDKNDKEAWVTERKRQGVWKDVVVIDGIELQDWLETAPAISLQLANEIGIVLAEGLQYADLAWSEWSYLTDPPISEDLVVAGREEQEKELIARLSSPSSIFTIRGDSPREAWGFTLAAVRRVSSEEERYNLHARMIVAENEDALRGLRHLNNHIVILKQAKRQISGSLASQGCHIVVPVGNDAHSTRNAIMLTHPTHRQFVEALATMRLQEDEAERIGRSCGRSITILQRLHAQANFERPRWSDSDTVGQLLPALLAGRWNNRSVSDQSILCQLAGASDYVDVENQLQQFLLVEEPPLRKIDEMWMLIAPVDAFQLIACRLTKANLDRFSQAFREVFSRIDPKVEKPPDEWIYLDIKGEKGHSDWLRSGLAEALLLIAERGVNAKVVCISSPRAFADEVVRGLPGLNDDWRVLASLRDQFARLMEAAPSPLLDSLERLLEAKPNDVQRLFAEGGLLGGGAMHTGLLWGLETLAWSPEYLPRVGLILAHLARLDPGGRMLNRPINSLREIFLWWHPGTHASRDQKLAAIDLILARAPDVGWSLLAALLPDTRQSISHGTAKPRWADIGDLPEDMFTRNGQIRYASAIVDRALTHVGSDSERWRAILDSLQMISESQQQKAQDLLETVARSAIPADEKIILWEMLRDFTYRHRTFQEANWALPGELLDRLEAVLPYLAPADLIERYRWLFEEWLPEVPSGEEDIDRRKSQTEELRRQAISEILATQGLGGLVRLGTICKFPGFVAVAAVSLLTDLDAVRDLVQQAIAVGEAGLVLASQISGRAQELLGEVWVEAVRQEARSGAWTPVVIASLLVWWPDSRQTWEEAEALGVADEYWRRKRVALIDGTPEEQAYQIERLIECGRAAEAFDRTALQSEGVPTEALVHLFDATFDTLAKADTAEEVRRLGLTAHDIWAFLEALRKRADLPREEVARREYTALPLLSPRDARGFALHDFMATEPDFFVSVICDAFRPAHRDKSQDVDPTPEAEARARTAYTLLKSMHLIPGQLDGARIDEEVLVQWISTVRIKATEVDRAAIADLTIGEILAHSTDAPEDNGWPHQVVRNVIERLSAEDIDRGLIIERHNMRGTYSKALYEGGNQERLLAQQYRGWAAISRARWPRMARVLDMIAEGWEEHARREDQHAEQDKWE